MLTNSKSPCSQSSWTEFVGVSSSNTMGGIKTVRGLLSSERCSERGPRDIAGRPVRGAFCDQFSIPRGFLRFQSALSESHGDPINIRTTSEKAPPQNLLEPLSPDATNPVGAPGLLQAKLHQPTPLFALKISSSSEDSQWRLKYL